MKLFVGLAVLISMSAFALATEKCKVVMSGKVNIPEDWIKLTQSECYIATQNQIRYEIGASYTYLQIAAHFSRDTVNRPGFADFFFKAAKEEREHAINLIEYLSMRGKLVDSYAQLTYPSFFPLSTYIHNNLSDTKLAAKVKGTDALTLALQLETLVTNNIRYLIGVCETDLKATNDYHFVDYLTGVYLDEQHKGQREIAEKLATLGKMQRDQGELAEFLFDKEL